MRKAEDYSPPIQATIKRSEIPDLISLSPKSIELEAEFQFRMRSGTRHSGGGENQRRESHFLEACFLCRRPLGFNRDIFMYKGNTAFCSKECRQEQIEIDEAQEKSWRISPSSTADKTTASRKKNVRTDTVAVA